MKAVILAGGKGLRFRTIISDIPKPMATIAGRPFLEYLILQLTRWNIVDIVISVGYRKDLIKSYFGSGKKLGANIEYSEEDELLGTGGAIKKASGLIGGFDFIAMNGDSLLNLNFDDFVSFHHAKKAKATIALARVHDMSRFGSVRINMDGEIIEFAEKRGGENGLINGGIYVFDSRVAEMIPEGKISLENDVLPCLAGSGLYGMVTEVFFVDIGVLDTYMLLCRNPQKLLDAVFPPQKL